MMIKMNRKNIMHFIFIRSAISFLALIFIISSIQADYVVSGVSVSNNYWAVTYYNDFNHIIGILLILLGAIYDGFFFFELMNLRIEKNNAKEGSR